MADSTRKLAAPRPASRGARPPRVTAAVVLLASLTGLLAGAQALALPAPPDSPAPPAGSAPTAVIAPTAPRWLRTSRDLWATIDVCDPPDQRYTVGIRGSMPDMGRAGERMFMRFRLQYLSEGRWVDLEGAASGLVKLPASNHQDGRSFTLKAPPHGAVYTLRGVVNFQWRRGSTLLAALSRATSAGHQSGSGADPAGFSAAQCRIA
jgi:hypothetical protein